MSKSTPKIRGFINTRHEFTREEKDELTRQLTDTIQSKQATLDSKKSTVAEFSSKIKTQDAAIAELTTRLGNGYEMKRIEVQTVFDRKAGTKRHFIYAPGKKEHGKPVGDEETMTEADYNTLPMEDLPPAAAKSEKKGKKKADAKKAADSKPANDPSAPQSLASESSQQ